MSEYMPKSGGTFTGDVAILGNNSFSVGGGRFIISKYGQRLGFGYSAETGGDYGSLCVGYQSMASGGYGCVSIGYRVQNSQTGSIVVGSCNATDEDYILICANGTSVSDRSNCFTVYTNGNVTMTGTLTSAGTEILTPATTTIAPQDNKVYKHTLADADVLTIDTSALMSTAQVQFELHLTQPSTAVTFTLPSGILWGDEYGDYDLSNPAPVIGTPNTVYCLVFRWDGEVMMGNLTYTRAVVIEESSSSGV